MKVCGHPLTIVIKHNSVGFRPLKSNWKANAIIDVLCYPARLLWLLVLEEYDSYEIFEFVPNGTCAHNTM